MSERSGFNSGNHGPMRSADAISYPVKFTRATLTSSSEVQAAVGYPVSTTITSLNEPIVEDVTERLSGFSPKLAVSVFGELRERPRAGTDLYPLRTTTETLTGDEGPSSPAPGPAIRVAFAQTAVISAKSSTRSNLRSRSLASDILNAALLLSVALLFVWRVPSLSVLDQQPVSGPKHSGHVAPYQKPAVTAAEPHEPSQLNGSSSAATQNPASEPSSFGTPSGSALAENTPVEVSKAIDTAIPTIALPNPPQQLPVPVPDSLEAAAASAMSAIRAADETSDRPRISDALSLLAEGQRRMQGGDVVGARESFGLAVDQGMAKAALALGSTYDPRGLTEMGIRDVVPDTTAALSWYRRAHLMAGPATNISPSAAKNE